MTRLRWRWLVWRARHYAYLAFFAYQRHPSRLNAATLWSAPTASSTPSRRRGHDP